MRPRGPRADRDLVTINGERVRHLVLDPFATRSPWWTPAGRVRTLGLLTAAPLVALSLFAGEALAAQPTVGLGTADSFAVLAGSTVTNTGPSTINGDVGLSPGTAVTGFPPGTVNGTIHAADAVAGQAKSDLTIAYDDAASRTPPLSVTGDLAGLTLTSGVYRNATSLGLTGALTLDAQGNPNAVFVFQAGSTLITASGSHVNLINGAQPCNVFWQVGSSATLGTSSVFTGSILALTSISVNNGVTIQGRALARNGAVTLINDTITAAHCTTNQPPAGAVTPDGGGAATGGTTSGGTSGGTTSGGTSGGTTTGGTTGGTTNSGTSGGTTSGGTTGGGTTTTGGGSTTSSANGTAIFTTTRSVAGTVAASGTRRAVPGTFKATVRGLHIRRVVFTVGRHVIATNGSSPFVAAVVTSAGIHTLKARVTYTDTTPAATFTLRFRSRTAPKKPVRAASAPSRLPKGSGGFTG